MLTPEQIADGWLPHDGVECPVPIDSRPGVMFHGGRQFDPGERTAGHWLVGYWTHHFYPQEHIIAYKQEP